MPTTSAEPVEVRVSHSGLRMVLVNRESVGLLDDSWAVLGVYFLLGPSEDDPDRYRAYVGEVGKRTLLVRIKEHLGGKQWWSRALLIASASDEFNSAEIGWLEGRPSDVLNNAVAAEVMNKGRPRDDSLAPQDRGVLERYVEPAMAALRACGASPDTADQKPPAPKSQKKKVYRESVKDLIDAGLLKSGTVLQPLRKGLTQTALVLPDGNLKLGEQVFTAVSPAAMAVSGNKSEPGWDFWGAPSGEGGYVPSARLREHLREDGGKLSAADSAGQGAETPALNEPVGTAVLVTEDDLEPLASTEAAPAKKSRASSPRRSRTCSPPGCSAPEKNCARHAKPWAKHAGGCFRTGARRSAARSTARCRRQRLLSAGTRPSRGGSSGLSTAKKIVRLYDLREQLRAAASVT